MSIRLPQVSSERLVAWLVPAAATAFVLWQFYPESLFRDTTPAFFDLGDHLTGPEQLREFLGRGRIAGWSQAWFSGYPSFTFYFPVPPLLAVVLDLLLPYNVAFKLATAAGPLTLPAVAYAFGRLHQRTRLTSACYGAATVVVLLQPLLYRLGGSVGSAAIGEYSYGIAFSCSLLVLGLAGAGLRTGRYRALTAVVLAAALMSHVVPTATAFVGLLVLTAIRPAWATVRWTASVIATAVALSAVWLVPLGLRLRFTGGPSAAKTESLLRWLWPSEMAPIALLAVLGLGATLFAYFAGVATGRKDLEIFMATMAGASAILIVVFPRMPVEDTRFLPSWFLWLSLAAAHAVAGLAELVDRRRARSTRGQALARPQLARLAAPVVLLVALLPLWDSRLGDGVLTRAKSKGSALPFARFNMQGYERTEMASEFQGLVDTLRRVARDNGCGRAHFEWNDPEWDGVRITLANLAPHWTDGCLTATTSVLYQSSATSPYLIDTNERLSSESVGLDGDTEDFDLDRGVADLRLLGVRYFGASHPRTQAAADASSALRLVAETKPYDGRWWKVYEVPGVQIIEPLRYEPLVVNRIDRSRRAWEDAARRWYDDEGGREVVVTSNGLSAWRHSQRVPTVLPRRPLPATTVHRVRVDDERISFDVSEPGIPVLVKVSYFPNWRADGADGPWRATPNYMVVVPRASTVTMTYGRTWPEVAGSVLTLGGIATTVFLARRPPLDMPTPHTTGPVPGPRPRKPTAGKKKTTKRRR